MSTVVHLEEKLFLLYFPTVITPIISDISALWMVQIKSSFKGRQRQSNYTPAQLKQLINLSAVESFGALNKMTWYFFIIISSVTAGQNCFCRRSSVWHHPWVKSPSPLFHTTRWWLWRAKCRGTAAALLAKIFLLRLLPAFGGDERGKPENTQETEHLRFCAAVQEVPNSLGGEVTFFFFSTLGIFQKVSQFAFN